MGGFECSSQRRRDGRRLDVIAATEHDLRAAADYRLMAQHGMRTVRDGVRWHRIEARAPRLDFSSFRPMLHAARDTGTQVIWDLLHYGWPDDLDIWTPGFVDRFAGFASAVARVVRDETEAVPWYTPVNEISFMAWGGGDVRYLNPFAADRGPELKRQLVRAAIAATHAIRDVDPRARFVTAEPLITIHPHRHAQAEDIARAARQHEAQFEAMDMLCGAMEPGLGGSPDCLDVVGLNYYYDNQWSEGGHKIYLGDPSYRPLSDLLASAADRYGRPIIIAETGTEGSGRAAWLHYVCDEAALARQAGVNLQGVCLYPVLNHPGWDDDRHCQNGLFCGVAPEGARTVYGPLADELHRQQALLPSGRGEPVDQHGAGRL